MKFKIHRVGRISEAVIEPRNFTMFFGKNDSGKTYAASTIWATINFIKNIPEGRDFPGIPPELRTYLSSFKNRGIEEGVFQVSIGAEALNALQKSVLDHLNNNIKKVLADAIGYDGFGASKVTIELEHKEPVTLTCRITENKAPDELVEAPFIEREQQNLDIGGETDAEPKEATWNFEVSVEGANRYVSKLRANAFESAWIGNWLPADIREEIIGYACFGNDWSNFRNTLYIPAARTGIMLALNYFVDRVVRRAELPLEDDKGASDLPGPIRHFASEMVRAVHSRVPPSTQGNRLSRLVSGQLKRGRRRGSFLYAPEGTATEIPLASTSSLVTELSPLALMWRRIGPTTFLIFEEPEAHLHLEAQREMARVLAHLVKRGAKILITTHSDTFIQQINNLIALSDHPERASLVEQLELSDDEIIDRNSVAAYDFSCRDGTTKVIALKAENAGFGAESLNDVIVRLAKETILISNGRPDSDD
ncbi:AAA family ATPase [Achromobacter sp. MY14]|uniref:AAA family ATPase n=1 Tax=unclassified Achromobacter TaxID=2626865 RepID=UPI001E363417|nr:AAA family ATPase [Achromobacter sp. MY14]MCD0501294.1 AAA family ATPase [Achromobacter sp. MY14]